MRLTSFEITSIVDLAKKHFTATAQVYLFGSRVNDQLKGGDIDLFIQADSELYRLETKIRFLMDLERAIGERKIDVVFDDDRVKKQSAFYHSIQTTKQLLNH